MQIGLLYDVKNPKPWFRPFPEAYAQALEHMQAMDELGFKSINMTEHHFDEDSWCPSLLVWNAAAAVKTKRAMLGQSVLLIPYAHPVRLAEDMATIDIISNGRFWLQAGEAYRPREFAALGIDRKHRAGMTAEGLEIIRKCWTEEQFSYEGRYYHLQNVRMQPKPVQRPHPPMFLSASVVGQKPMERTVAMGFGGTTNMGSDPGKWNAWHEGWTETIRRHGKDPAQFQTSTILPFFITDDPERAWRKHRDAVLYAANGGRRESDRPQPLLETPEQAPNWQNIFQTPDAGAKYLRQLYGKNPPTHLLLWANRPFVTYADSLEYHRLFMDKVEPQLRDLK